MMRARVPAIAGLVVVCLLAYRACKGGTASPTVHARVGNERTYSCELTLTAQTGAGTLVDLRVTGTLALTVIATAPALTARAQLADVRLALDGSAAGTQEARVAVEHALGRPFFLTYGADGALTDVRAAGEPAPFVAGVFRALGAAIVIAAPAHAEREWQVTEHDTGGGYVARFRAAADRRELHKEKVRYLDGGTAVVASHAQMRFTDGHLEVVGAEETLRTTQGALPDAELATTLALRHLETRDQTDQVTGWSSEHRRLPRLAGEATTQTTFD